MMRKLRSAMAGLTENDGRREYLLWRPFASFGFIGLLFEPDWRWRSAIYDKRTIPSD